MHPFENLPPSRYHTPDHAIVIDLPGHALSCVRSFNIQTFMQGGPFESRRLQRGDTLLLGTGNVHKLHELAHSISLNALFNCMTTKSLGLGSPDETGTTYFDNAAIKALDAAAKSGLPCLGDDRGIAIDAHKGQPGIDTIEWLRDPKVGFAHIEKMKRNHRSMRATSVCAMALAWPDGVVAGVEIHTRGRLVWPPRGTNGFGFDTCFVRDGERQTYGEMSTLQKGMRGEIGDAIRYVTNHLADATGIQSRLGLPRQMELKLEQL